MMMKAMADATPWVAMVASVVGSQRESALDQSGERRLADPAEAQRGERDAELGGGDVAVERLYRAAGQPSFAIPRPGHLVQPRCAARRPARTRPPRRRRSRAPGRRPRRDRGRSRAMRPVPYGTSRSASKVLPRGLRDDSRAGRAAVRGARPASFPAVPAAIRRPGTAVRAHPGGRARPGRRGGPGVHPPVRRRGPGARRLGARRRHLAGGPGTDRSGTPGGAGPGRGPGPRLPRAPAGTRLPPQPRPTGAWSG